jgi:hypothetical protein
VTDETSGKKPRKPPERADALSVPLPFDAAIKAALETEPPPEKKKSRMPRKGASDPADTA